MARKFTTITKPTPKSSAGTPTSLRAQMRLGLRPGAGGPAPTNAKAGPTRFKAPLPSVLQDAHGAAHPAAQPDAADALKPGTSPHPAPHGEPHAEPAHDAHDAPAVEHKHTAAAHTQPHAPEKSEKPEPAETSLDKRETELKTALAATLANNIPSRNRNAHRDTLDNPNGFYSYEKDAAPEAANTHDPTNPSSVMESRFWVGSAEWQNEALLNASEAKSHGHRQAQQVAAADGAGLTDAAASIADPQIADKSAGQRSFAVTSPTLASLAASKPEPAAARDDHELHVASLAARNSLPRPGMTV